MKFTFLFGLCCLVFALNSHAQKAVKAPCWNISFTNEGETDTATTEIYGKLYDLHGHGIAFTRIVMGKYSAVTDEAGNYRFEPVVAGTYEIYPHSYCPLSARKTRIKKGKKLRMNICVTIEETHLPGLGIPGEDK